MADWIGELLKRQGMILNASDADVGSAAKALLMSMDAGTEIEPETGGTAASFLFRMFAEGAVKAAKKRKQVSGKRSQAAKKRWSKGKPVINAKVDVEGAEWFGDTGTGKGNGAGNGTGNRNGNWNGTGKENGTENGNGNESAYDVQRIVDEQNEVLDLCERAGIVKTDSERDKVLAMYADFGLGKMKEAVDAVVMGQPEHPLQYLAAIVEGRAKKPVGKETGRKKTDQFFCGYQQREVTDDDDPGDYWVKKLMGKYEGKR